MRLIMKIQFNFKCRWILPIGPVRLCSLLACFAIAGCHRQSEPQSVQELSNVKLTNYTVTEFKTFPSFQGKVLTKLIATNPSAISNKTNYLFTIVLEDESGEKFSVSSRDASQDVLERVNDLEKDHSYAFPSSLFDSNSTR